MVLFISSFSSSHFLPANKQAFRYINPSGAVCTDVACSESNGKKVQLVTGGCGRRFYIDKKGKKG